MTRSRSAPAYPGARPEPRLETPHDVAWKPYFLAVASEIQGFRAQLDAADHGTADYYAAWESLYAASRRCDDIVRRWLRGEPPP